MLVRNVAQADCMEVCSELSNSPLEALASVHHGR